MSTEFEYFAFVNDENIVENVIVCNSREDFQELMKFNPMGMVPGRWVPGSSKTGRPSKGNHYDPQEQHFYPQCRFPSWTLNKEIWQWEPPVPKPKEIVDENGSLIVQWEWNEPSQEWVEMSGPNCIECGQDPSIEKIDEAQQ